MLFNIILLFIILLILTVILRYSQNTKESFFDFPVGSHTNFVEDSTKKLNSMTNMINLPDPAISITPISQNDVNLAIGNLKQDANILVPTLKYQTPSDLPKGLAKAQLCQKAGPTCSAFDNPDFALNCGVSFDINGIGSDGKPHMGGMFLSFDDRDKQVAAAQHVLDTNSAPYDPYNVYQPTLGTSKPGTFGITKDSCVVVKEKVDCLSKQTFNSPNCTQCYTSQDFARVGPETGRIASMLVIAGNGMISITSSGGIALDQRNLTTDPVKVEVPANAEGTSFYIRVTQSSPPTYLSGYIQGETPKGTFKLDIMHLIQSDTVTNAKVRINGTKYVNGFRCFSIVPGAGHNSMNLSCLMPFSFLSMYDGDALTCDNGPIITKAASATFLESDPCFGKANQPGNYKLECLQTRWIELGGTPEGTGYPINQANADLIQKDANGSPLDIDTIVDNLAVTMIQALTGKDVNGTLLSIPDWNTASMYATGVPINTPCDGPGGMEPLSQQCLSYLYSNKDATSRIGATYSLPSAQYSSKKGEGFMDTPLGGGLPMSADSKKKVQHEGFTDTYNYPNAPLDPNTASGLAFGQNLGGIAAVKQSYDQVNRLANDNTKSNDERNNAVQQAYGINLGSAAAKKKDFDVRIPANQSTQTYDDLRSFCESKGQRLCESSEICDMSARTVINPEITSEFPDDNWIAVADQDNEWLTLNRADNRYCKTHTEVANYLPDWGKSRDPGGWERLAKCCGGERIIQGRYIRFQYDRVECLNLAQIAVYSSSNGDNIITPSTRVTKSSGFQGDVFPVQNFINGSGNTFVHSSCYDVPWIMVDLQRSTPIYKVTITNRHDCCQSRILGAYLIVLNEEMQPVYQSNPIDTTNQTYTWFPPSKNVFVDYIADKPSPSFKHVGCWGDTDDRAIPTLEGTDARLDGGAYNRQNAIAKCYNVAKDKGMKVFGVQNTGWCAGSTDLTAYKKYGKSGACYGAGTGGPWANDVYIIGDDSSAPGPRTVVHGNNGTTTCERYCSGVGGGPWNGEMPVEWNGAKCVGTGAGVANCYSHFGGGGTCTCEATGTGWRQGGFVDS